MVFPYRLGESQADQGSVEEACAQNVECVEADRVPNADMRSQLLPGKKTHKHVHDTRRGTPSVCCDVIRLTEALTEFNEHISGCRVLQLLSLRIKQNSLNQLGEHNILAKP